MKFNNLKIGTRLGSGFALLLVLMAVMLAAAIWQLERISDAKSVMEVTHKKAQLSQEWVAGITSNSVRTLAKAKTTNPTDEAFFDSEMKALSGHVKEVEKQLAALVDSQRGKELLQTVTERRERYSAIRQEMFALKNRFGAEHPELKNYLNGTLVPAMKDYVLAVEDVAAYQEQLFDDAKKHIDELSADATQILFAIGVTALIFGATCGLVLTRSITRPLATAVSLAQQVASGDLTADINVSSRDEVGDLLASLKTMNANLLKTVTEVRIGTETIVTASQQIASGNLDLSSRTEQQASSLEETASSMEELTGIVRQNAQNARQANSLAQSASDVAARGGEVVSQVVATMASINESSKSIGDIIGVIDGIAFQTNILALNAAVEAARAGEQGRGFAVVASEVRNLAHRSAAAAKEIRNLISVSIAKVDAGGLLVGRAGSTMHEIVEGIERVTVIMSEIASASEEQRTGIEQVNAAINQMDDVTQQNAALVEEAAAAAGSLQDQALSLERLVGAFKVGSAGHVRNNSVNLHLCKYSQPRDYSKEVSWASRSSDGAEASSLTLEAIV